MYYFMYFFFFLHTFYLFIYSFIHSCFYPDSIVIKPGNIHIVDDTFRHIRWRLVFIL